MARPAAQGQFTFVAIAFGCLAWSFINNDFSVLNVATNSNSQLPLQYRLAATWGSHEGSLLLWVLMLNVWTVAVTVFSRHLPAPVVSRILAVMALVGLGLLLFLFSTQVLAGGGNKEQIQIWPTKGAAGGSVDWRRNDAIDAAIGCVAHDARGKKLGIVDGI